MNFELNAENNFGLDHKGVWTFSRRKMLAMGGGVAAAAVAGSALGAPQAMAATTFRDDFDGGWGSRPGGWNYETGYGNDGWGNHEWQNYTADQRNVMVNGAGILVIRGQSAGGWSSARMNSYSMPGGRFRYGWIEAEILIPSAQGSWPAFWLLGEGNNWPHTGELDIMEHVNNEPWIQGSAHSSSNFGGSSHHGQKNFGRSIAGEWHRYALDWKPNEIKWYVDGENYYTLNKSWAGAWPFDNNFFMILNMAIGGTWPGNANPAHYPAETMVRYVLRNDS